jgi:uncharacterized cupredoxin-like copper-binding protein
MRRSRRMLVALGLGVALLASACGSDSTSSQPAGPASGSCVVTQIPGADADAEIDPDALSADQAVMVVSVDMGEYSYDCDMPVIPSGVVVAFQFTNNGQLPHEAAVGTLDDQLEAEAATVELRPVEHDHSVPSVIVQPESTGQLLVYYDEPTSVIIGCHISGHWNQGMQIDLEVGTG